MKKIILIVFVLFSFATKAQNVVIGTEWSKEYKKKAKAGASSLTLLGFDSHAYYAHPEGDFGNIISHSKDQKEEKIGKLKYSDKNGDRKPEFMMMYDNELYVFSSSQNAKHKKHYLFVQQIDKQTLQLQSSLKQVAEIEYGDVRSSTYIDFSFSFSNDSSKILIHNLLFSKKEENEILKGGFAVLDKDFSVLWGNENFLSQTQDVFEMDEMIVDNAGDVYLLGKTLEGQDSKTAIKGTKLVRGERNIFGVKVLDSKNISTANYKVIRFPYNNKDIVKSPLISPEQGMRIDNMSILINNNSEVVGCGIVALTGQISARGVFSMRLNQTSNSIEERHTKYFSLDFLTKAMKEKDAEKLKEKWQEKEEFEGCEYRIRKMHNKLDGGFIFVAEKYEYYEVASTTSGGTARTNTSNNIFIYGDIFVVNCESDSKIKWIQKIPKYQECASFVSQIGSFALAFDRNDNAYFFYNAMDPKKSGYSYKADFVTVKLAEHTGKETGETLFTSKKTKNTLVPRKCMQISDNEILIFSQKSFSSKSRYLKITF